MIQNYFGEPMIKNYMAPTFPLFIALKNSLQSINSKKAMRDAKNDINSFVQKIGPEGEKFVLYTLFEHIEFPDLKEKTPNGHKIGFLAEAIKDYSLSESFLFYFPEVLAKVSKDAKTSLLLNNLFNVLKLPLPAQISISISLYLSDRRDYSEVGEGELCKKLVELRKSSKGNEVSEKLLEQLLFQISRNPELMEKLEEEYNYLLEVAETNSKISEVRIYNYFKGEWQFFANEAPVIEKPPSIGLRKVDFLRDIGPPATFKSETLKAVINEIGPLNEEDVFECMFMMAEERSRTDSGLDRFVTGLMSSYKKNSKNDLKAVFEQDLSSKKSTKGWNVDEFLNYCAHNVQNLKWQNVFSHFDRTKLSFASEDHFLTLMKYFEKTKKIGQKWKMPENIYFKKWSHLPSQAVFLLELFKCKEPEVLFLHEIQNKKVQKNVKDCNVLERQIWGYLDLVQLLVEVADFKYIQIRELFETPILKYPEVLIHTLSEIRPSKGQALLDQVFSHIFPQILHNHSTNTKMLEMLWESNQDLVISTICEIYKNDSKKENSFNLSRVLDITQFIKDSLIPFTTWNDYDFSIPLAVIAGKREFLNFEPWIIDRIQKLGNSFIKAILLYIDTHLIENLKKNHSDMKMNILEKAQLTIELLNKIFYSIMSKTKREDMAPRNFEYLKRLFKECCQYFPDIAEGQIPDEIERQTEREINRIYKEEITIKEAIERMKKLKNSNKQEDQEQLASHITFLCSELTYHHSYPEKELMITAELFAAIINANLIEKKVYQMFLHVLEEDLKEDNQKYTFAIKVMERIKPKLAHESWFCEKLIDNEIVLKKHPQFVEELIKNLEPHKILPVEKEKKIKDAIKLKNSPPPEPIVMVVPAEEEIVIDPIKKIQSNDYDILATLDKTKRISLPDKENKLSRINMICNTLSMTNYEDKARDLEKILDNDKVIKLLAYNIVFKRISITQNNGTEIFSRLLEKLPRVEAPVLKVTYKILQHWFSLTNKSAINDKKLSNFKNIGSWLGKLTIGKGIPVPFYKLNLKNILIASFANGTRINMNIPVVIKILEYINLHPEIFRPTSPWLSRLFGTLNEIEDKLKDDQTAKSEIKAFFKSTSMKLESFQIPQTSYLNTNNRIVISGLEKFTEVDKELQKYYENNLKIDLKMIITRAIDDSIQEIVEPVIDRAVKIAKVTTKQLIMKDFALEPDPERFRESSYNVVKKMAGPLAQVTCREPLKASMNRSLKALLSQSLTDQAEIESIIQKAIPDNLDFGCQLIKQAVIESAEDVIKKDSAINQSIELRIKAIKDGVDFRDDIYLREIPSIVPEELRPKHGGLSMQEYSVYNEFKKEKVYFTPQKLDSRSSLDRVMEIVQEKGPLKGIKDILLSEQGPKDDIIFRIYRFLIESSDDSEVDYLLEICLILKDCMDSGEIWKFFREEADLKRKDIHSIVKRLVKEKCLPENSLDELDQTNDQEIKVIKLFEKWLKTAHEQIQPFLRDLEQNFNKSQNQIKIFFSFSLNYAMKKVKESMWETNQAYDTNYIEDYSKLIIISYKTIASNNCSLYFEHTIQAILQIFDRLNSIDSDVSYQRPFFKLFTNLICDVTRKEYDIDNEKVLTFYCVLAKELQKISPLNHPSFAFAWVELISNKNFMPAMLERYEYWDLYYNLLSSLLKFVREYITEEVLYGNDGQAYQCFYKGILKLIIIIIHDFPDFLSAFSLQLCLFAGPRFIQLNNMIISAYPKEMKFEFPLKVDKREDLEAQAKKGGYPKYYRVKMDKPKFKKYLSADPKDPAFKEALANEEDEFLQTFILYAGSPEVYNENENIRKVTVLYALIQDILVNSDEKMRVRLITFIINLIRYPNSVTLLFIDLVSSIIFKQSKENSVKEAILVNILSRMNAEGPQAWGLIYLARKIQIHKNEINIPKKLLEFL